MSDLRALDSPINDLPEEILVRLAQANDEDAFKELMTRSWEMCTRIARYILSDREDAIDEVQTAFWKAHVHIGSFNQRSKFSTWVARIVTNLCLMRLRQMRRLPLVPSESVNSAGEVYVAHEAIYLETPERVLGEAEVRNLVRSEVKNIPAFLRSPLELHFIHDLSVEEVARSLNISIPATKSRLHRAQRYLRARMLRHCGLRGVGTLTRAI